MRIVSVTSLLAGVALMALSFAWPSLVREQLIKKNTAVVVRDHEAMGIMHSSTASDNARLQAKVEHHKAQRIVRDRIKMRDTTVWALRTGGIVLAVVGVMAYLRLHSQLQMVE